MSAEATELDILKNGSDQINKGIESIQKTFRVLEELRQLSGSKTKEEFLQKEKERYWIKDINERVKNETEAKKYLGKAQESLTKTHTNFRGASIRYSDKDSFQLKYLEEKYILKMTKQEIIEAKDVEIYKFKGKGDFRVSAKPTTPEPKDNE